MNINKKSNTDYILQSTSNELMQINSSNNLTNITLLCKNVSHASHEKTFII